MKLPPPPERLLDYLKMEAPLNMNEWEPILVGQGDADMISLSESERGSVHKYIKNTPCLEDIFVEVCDRTFQRLN